MSNLIKTLKSGATIEVTLGSFSEGHRLFKAVMRELEKVNIEFESKGKNLGEIFNGEIGDKFLNTLKNLIARLVSSDEVEAALWPCMNRGKYEGKAIRSELFENEDIRGDYIEISKEVLWFNLLPFCKNLDSLLSILMSRDTGVQKLKSD